ncbi:MAG TPA: EAL domain-containing protein [Spirochaetales bacterium]|jgi:diguanylate cyclase (GGDEF)-like protein|nr:EAL domain-containing protein [Spirochaetales bacterium]
MTWNVAPEIVSLGLLLVILQNASMTKWRVSPREKFFIFSLYYTIFAIVLNLLSMVPFVQNTPYGSLYDWIFNTAYFVFYPPLSLIFNIYIVYYIAERAPKESSPKIRTATIILLLSIVIYQIVPIFNFKTNWLFYFDSQGNYIRGLLNHLPLGLAIFGILVGLSLVISQRHYIDPYFFKVIVWLPIITIVIIVLQSIFTQVILTGATMVLALTAIYLNFQTSKISIDNLTQFLNRETFVATLVQLINTKQKTTVMVVSLNNFKVVNDTFGQAMGDRFLKAVANSLAEIVPQGEVYRYGGDEFAIITTKGRELSMVGDVMNRFKSHWSINGITSRLGASFAILQLPFKDASSVDATSLLEFAIQRAKEQGSGQAVYCDALILEDIKRRTLLADHLLQSQGESFSLHFQPIYSLVTGEVFFVEALLRMESEKFGKVLPSEFIPLAEELGIIGDLSRWVLEKSCQLLSRHPQLPTISLNFSGLQFNDPSMILFVKETLQHYQVPPSKINIELTESTFFSTFFEDALAFMDELIAWGIKFHLDDFGTGYSSLSRMIALPFACIKIDRSLLRYTSSEKAQGDFIKSIVSIVKQLGFCPVIEGIESEEELQFLRTIGCDFGQGYHLQRPLPQDQFLEKFLT